MQEQHASAFRFEDHQPEPLVEDSDDKTDGPSKGRAVAKQHFGDADFPAGARYSFARRTVRLSIVTALDFLAIAATLLLVAGITDSGLAGQPQETALFVCFFAGTATLLLAAMGLYRRSWRFTRFADCLIMIRSVAAVLAVAWIGSLLVVPSLPRNASLLPLVVLHGFAVFSVMTGMRATRRLLRERKNPGIRKLTDDSEAEAARRVLVVGSPDWACTVIEVVRSDRASKTELVGVLLTSDSDTIGTLCGVPVLGGPGMLASAVAILQERDKAPSCLIMSDHESWPDSKSRAKVIERAKMLGLEIGRVSDPWSQMLQGTPGAAIEKLSTAQLLGRPEYTMDGHVVDRFVRGRRVLVTGAGGTIGGELARQLASFGPAELTLLDHSEHDLYRIDQEIRKNFPERRVRVALCSIRERDSLREVFREADPELVFHAAALKHVPMVEENPCAGVQTNVLGTRNVADLACEFSVKAMVQVSTDKAVNPVGIMGATKRIGEIYCQALDLCGIDDSEAPRFITVRFGNVLGSSGSIVPLFKQQLAEGRDLTVTHPDITRYFMTVGEAVQLILQSSAHAIHKETDRGNIYVLDMGEPVKIIDLARQMIRLSGLEPEIDIGIRVVGLRPGEKLFEELFDTCEEQVDSRIPGIFEARSRTLPLPLINKALGRLEGLVAARDSEEIKRVLLNLVRIPSGKAAADLPFGDFSTLMLDYSQGNFTNGTSDSPSIR